jgi:predicted ATPase
VSVSQAGPLKSYLDLISQGKLQFDPRQKQVAVLLQTLYDDLIPYYERSSTTDTLTRTDSNCKPDFIILVISYSCKTLGLAKYSTLFGFALPHEQHSLVSQPPKSIYLWGGTGSGKTHLMNVFYDSLPFQMKRRIHFNNFMINVHKVR